MRIRAMKKQSQNNPNFRKAKMNLNFYSTKDYENKPPLPAPGKQTQSNPIPPHDSTTIISTVFSKCPLIKILIRLQITYNMIVSMILSELNYEAHFGQTN